MPERGTDLKAFVRRYDAMMADPAVREAYGETGFFNVGYRLSDTDDQATACAALVRRVLATVPETIDRILDAGCGCGAGTSLVKQLRPLAEVIGINISESQLLQCRTSRPECGFALMDAARLGFRSEAFDCVAAIEAAFHFHSRQAFLAETFRVLRPGGYLVLADILFRDLRWIGEWMVPADNDVATLDDYALLLAESGYCDAALIDETGSSWTAFCRARLHHLRSQMVAGRLDEAAFAGQAEYFANLMQRSVDAYLIVSARKPLRARG